MQSISVQRILKKTGRFSVKAATFLSELWSACDLGKRKLRTDGGLAKYLDSVAIEKAHVKFCQFILGVNTGC